MKLKDKVVNSVLHLVGALSQGEGHHNPNKTVMPGMPALVRQVAAEGAVLLENRVLPLESGTKVAVFGRVQVNHFYTGYGSGGDVNMPYAVNLLQGLRGCEELVLYEPLAKRYEHFDREHPIDHGSWGSWPRHYPEMPLSEVLVKKARKHADQAVIILGRSSGEDRENVLEPGSYYLTEAEKAMLRMVTTHFPDAVLLLNIGSVMDLSFLEDYCFGAVMILWQGGMESGNAAADLLCGKTTPSGRLTDTVAKRYGDHPSAAYFGGKKRNEYWEDIYVGYRYFETFAKDQVQYPFAYGLSYTTFEKETKTVGERQWQVTVTNTGSLPGKETVLLYLQKPCGKLGNPERELVAFAKTKLLQPGEQETLTLTVPEEQLASFDDSGATGHKDCYVIQAGIYRFFLGGDVRDAQQMDMLTVDADRVIAQLQEAAAPQNAFPILAARDNGDGIAAISRNAQARTVNLKARILENLPADIAQTGDKGWKLEDVKAGRVDLDAFVAQLSLEELEAITRGGYVMDHPLGAKGNAGVFGGVTDSLREKGVIPVVTTDGPSGIRLYDSCSLMPIGTLLASTFDEKLLEELMTKTAEEMALRGSDVLLAPGMNIHRNPLCGRNFEYFSEDPYVSGKIAAAVVRGIQSGGLSACPKHYACNNQEYRRNTNDSVVSQRALREIYLKGFEICVKESAPKIIMSSYNLINGARTSECAELLQGILRGEWGFKGMITTDWSNCARHCDEVKAGNDIRMPASQRGKLTGAVRSGYVTRDEMAACAKRILEMVLWID